MTTKELLQASLKRIREIGWRADSGGMHEVDTPLCMINTVAKLDWGGCDPAFHLLKQAIGESYHFYLAKWNDAPGRTQAEVEAAFERAIELA